MTLGESFTVTFAISDPDNLLSQAGVECCFRDGSMYYGPGCQSTTSEASPGTYFVQANCVAPDNWPAGRYGIVAYADDWDGLYWDEANGELEMVE